jgi:hypothetical protein
MKIKNEKTVRTTIINTKNQNKTHHTDGLKYIHNMT